MQQSMNKKLAYIYYIRENFIKNLIKTWKKRNYKILHIGINNGIEPSFFWDLGFEVTALAQNTIEMEKSAEKNGKKIDYVIAQYDHLPFDEKTFDHVFITHVLAKEQVSNFSITRSLFSKQKQEAKENFKNNKSIDILCEAIRASANAVFTIEFSNIAFHKVHPSLSPFALKQLTEHICSERDFEYDFYSALPLPSLFWTKKTPINSIQSSPYKIPFGTLMATMINNSPVLMNSTPLKAKPIEQEVPE